MGDSLKNIIKIKLYKAYRAVLKKFKKKNLGVISFSQEGEDLILLRYFENKKTGFYVDIGAHHPIRFSNTYKFYLQGWQGINIDPMPGCMDLFNKIRPRDINLEVGISNITDELNYYIFNEPALNTFSLEKVMKIIHNTQYKIINSIVIQTLPLQRVLSNHLPVGQEIDFMSIDVEGFDLSVLESNDWNLYRPKIILIEELNNLPIDKLFTDSHICKKLIDEKYILIGKTYNTLLFKDLNSSHKSNFG